MEFIFGMQNEIKQEYLSTKPSKTAESDAFVLRAADEYEILINKQIYNMSYADLKEMVAMQFKNSSIKSIVKNISVLKNYIDFCLDKKLVLHGENRLAPFTVTEAKDFVHRQALISKFITKKRLKEYQDMLYNEQDKLLLELLYIGVRGRTTKDGTYEEVINLSIEDVNKEENTLILRQNDGELRLLTDVDISTISLIQETYDREIYVENNGEQTENKRISKPRQTVINHVDKYVFRIPGKNKFNKLTTNLMNSRMNRIQHYLDNHYITYTSLYQSGMIQLAINIYQECGDVTSQDFQNICARYGYEKYWYNIRDLFNQYKELLLN